MKVYIVHYETGLYSCCDYDVLGVFSSMDEARKYVESVTCIVDFKKFVIPLNKSQNLDERYSQKQLEAIDIARPVDQGDGRWLLMAGGERALLHGYDLEFFIIEYELDSAPDVSSKLNDLFHRKLLFLP